MKNVSQSQAKMLAALVPITGKDKAKTIAENSGAAITETIATPGSVVASFGKGLKKGFGFEEKAKVADFRDPDGNIVKCEVDTQGKPVRILN